MTDADIQSIESALGVSLPQVYRDSLCPFPLRAYQSNADTDLWDDASKLIALNQEARTSQGVPTNLYLVGRDGGGVMTAIDLSTPDFQVWWIDRDYRGPETFNTKQPFVDWTTELFRQMQTGEYWDGFDPENDPPGTRGDTSLSQRGLIGCGGVIFAAMLFFSLIAYFW